jgi:lipoic acid synthetase
VTYTLITLLFPQDFRGDKELISLVAQSGLDVYAHNLETVERLQRRVRDYRAGYQQSLNVLKTAKNVKSTLLTKTSLMLGLGESSDEVKKTIEDIKNAGIDIITLGQYLRPTRRHMTVQKFVSPEEFNEYEVFSKSLGFKYVASGPLVRSSYRAGELFVKGILQNQNM